MLRPGHKDAPRWESGWLKARHHFVVSADDHPANRRLGALSLERQ
jgi:hypothetical protein